MRLSAPLRSEFDSYDDYQRAMEAWEDAMDDYVNQLQEEELIKRYF
jgi:hypothetical protein